MENLRRWKSELIVTCFMCLVAICLGDNCRTATMFLAAEKSIKAGLVMTENDIDDLLQTTNTLRGEAIENDNRWKAQITRENNRFLQIQRDAKQVELEVAENHDKIASLTRRRDENNRRIDFIRAKLVKIRAKCIQTQVDTPINCPSHITGRDCAEVKEKGGRSNGIYFIQPSDAFTPFPVYCDQETDGGGWTYIHSHVNDEFDFNRSWLSYKHGFGHVTCGGPINFWIGNDVLHEMTSSREYHMRADVTDWSGNAGYAVYSTFSVGSESDNYRLRIGGYRQAGEEDSIIEDGFRGHNFGHPDDVSFTNHNGMKFSTFDRDNDRYQYNCANQDGGGWWFNRCSAVNLNGRVYNGGFYSARETMYGFDNAMIWGPWTGLWYSLQTSGMKIRPLSFDRRK